MTESLSRLIDDDLDPAEREELQEILEIDRGVRRELEGLSRVRASFHALASREVPPARLDALVDPLLRGRPEPSVARPWVRWLATAAVVVLGVTVVFEIERRQPDSEVVGWQQRALDDVASEPTERFALAPLPTSAEPADSRKVGVLDRLVSGPEPEVASPSEADPVLEVMGPLDRGSLQESASGGSGPDRSAAAGGSTTAHRGDTSGGRVGSSEKIAGADAAPDSATGPQARSLARSREAETPSPAAAGGQLFVFMESQTAWSSFEPEGPCEPGRYVLRIRVDGGVVREVWPLANPPATTSQVRASQLVLGLHVDDVDDGEYAAEVVIEPRHLTDP